MTRIAVSGHRGFSPDVEAIIDRAVRTEIDRYPASDLVGVSCLADGADQIFARAVLDAGGKLEAVIPAEHYRDGLPEWARPEYDELRRHAIVVHRLDRVESTSSAYMDASIAMLKGADVLFAVWDGQPARSFGGTADVVDHARRRGVRVTVIWPEGARRD
jgi:hypothetical protein